MTFSWRSRRPLAGRSASAGDVLSDLARDALTHRVRDSEIREAESFYGFEPVPRRGPAVSNELIDRLREEDPD